MNTFTKQETEIIIVAALYKFVALPDYIDLRETLLSHCKKNGLKGTLLLAEEGINGTVAGSRQGIDSLCAFLSADSRFKDMEYKESITNHVPFHRMKIKLKKEIVTMGISYINPSAKTGKRLNAKQWNEVINDPDVLVIDTRNQYEFGIGTFKNAISPETESFREFPGFVRNKLDKNKDKKIAMFCTGGIRCEKASAYLLSQGFNEVYQLNGGILRYLEDVPGEENHWQGECFVFDGRVAVDENLEQGSYEQCFACRRPVSEEDLKSDKYQQGISCPNCFDDLTEQKRARFKERQKQVELSESRNEQHIGKSLHLKQRNERMPS